MKIPGWMVKIPEEHEENAIITARTSTELHFRWGGVSFVYNRARPWTRGACGTCRERLIVA